MHPPLICFAIIYEGEGKIRTANGKLLDFCGADKLSRMKVLITVTQTDHPHRMKVLIKLFQKFAQVEGAKPSSRPQARNFSAFLVLFAPAVPKRTEWIFSM